MSLLPRKKSNSWHQKSSSFNLEKKINNIISTNNKSIFSELLKAKLSNTAISQKNFKTPSPTDHYPINNTINNNNNNNNEINFCSISSNKNHLNSSFSRLGKCDCCGSNNFYETSKLKTCVNEMLKPKKKHGFSPDFEYIQKFSINDLAHQSNSSRNVFNLIKQKSYKDKYEEFYKNNEDKIKFFKSQSTHKNPTNVDIQKDYFNDNSVTNHNLLETDSKKHHLPQISQQNYYYQDYIPFEANNNSNKHFNKIFDKKPEKEKKITNPLSSSPTTKNIDNGLIEAMLSLKKELPTAFSNKSMNRKEIIIMRNWFSKQEEILNKQDFKTFEEKANNFFELYSICLNEVIKEISV